MRVMVLWAIGLLALSGSAAAEPPAHAEGGFAVEAPPGFREACGRYAWLCRADPGHTQQLSDARLLGIATRVNARVNRAIMQVDDSVNHGAAEYWALPRNGRGDCEDIALLKMKLLLEEGVLSKDLVMAIVLDRRGDNHAVLLLRLESGDVMLDSLTETIALWHRSGYRVLARQAIANKSQWEALLPAAGQ